MWAELVIYEYQPDQNLNKQASFKVVERQNTALIDPPYRHINFTGLQLLSVKPWPDLDHAQYIPA